MNKRQYVKITKYSNIPTIEGCTGCITNEDDLQWFVQFLDNQRWSGGISVSKSKNTEQAFSYISEIEALYEKDFNLNELKHIRCLLKTIGAERTLENNEYKLIMKKLDYKIDSYK
jgi:hypothetical protein